MLGLKVLVYGNGGREHALAWKLSQSRLVSKLFFVKPNALMASLGETISASNFNELAEKAKAAGVSLAIIGPEMPLAKGIANILEKRDIATFGPHREQVWLESSKARAKKFNFRNNIPCAYSVTVENFEDAKKAFSKFEPPYVLKSDGLAGGKGVIIVDNIKDALREIRSMLEGKFGDASRRVVIEEFLKGSELSALCLYDGKTLLPMDFARDHKKLMDGDKGPNTGGMGAYSPVVLKEEQRKSVFDVLNKISRALKKEEIKYHGVLYVGMMITNEGAKVLEYNVRFGDPETQALVVRLENDFGEVVNAVVEQHLDKIELKWGKPSNTLVIASKGYPFSPQKNVEITGIEKSRKATDVVVFGGAIKKKDGKLVSNGGRVLSATAVGKDAHKRTLEFAKLLKFDAKFYRKDIF